MREAAWRRPLGASCSVQLRDTVVGPQVGMVGGAEGTAMSSLYTPEPWETLLQEGPPSGHGLGGGRVGLATGRECGFVLGKQRTELGALFSWGWGWGRPEGRLLTPEAEPRAGLGWAGLELATSPDTREDPRGLEGEPAAPPHPPGFAGVGRKEETVRGVIKPESPAAGRGLGGEGPGLGVGGCVCPRLGE